MPSSYTVQRIACLQPSATVILNAVGELDRVVACTKYCADVVPAVADGSRTILSDSWTADAKQIIGTRPDLVITAVPYQEKAVAEILKSGSRFLGLAPSSLSDIFGDIATIAGAVGAGERGEEIILAMQKRIEQVTALTRDRQKPAVFCEEWGKPVITSQKWVAELVNAAGGTFLYEPGRAVPLAELQGFDADVMVAAWCGAGDRVPLDKIIADRGWHGTSAARAGRVFCIRDEYLNTPAPTLLQGLEALAFAIHPELFSRPQGIRQITDGLVS